MDISFSVNFMLICILLVHDLMLPYCDNLHAKVRRRLLQESQMTDAYTYNMLTSCFHPMNEVIRRDLFP